MFRILNLILSCDHSGTGSDLLVPFVCEIIFLAEALLKGVCISKDSGVVTNLIILQTVLFLELLWEILLIFDYLPICGF